MVTEVTALWRESLQSKEYGFSKAVQELCPQEWKNAMGSDGEEKLDLLIIHWSLESYLTKGKSIKTESELRFSIASQAGNLSQKIYKECGVGIEKLKELKKIYLVYIEKQVIVSCVYEKQQKILDKIGINLEYK